MRLLLDACVGPSTLKALREHGHEAERIVDDPGDVAILERARVEARVLVTADKDFGALIFAGGHARCGILRIVDHPLARQPQAVLAALGRYETDLTGGAMVVVEPGRVRVRPAPPS